MKKERNIHIAVIGLGYVGLPLAVEFSKITNVVGFDINIKRILQLKAGNDLTKELNSKELKAAKNLSFSNEVNDIKNCNIYIITVPTPIDNYKKPNLQALLNASEIVGCVLNTQDIVIYESTVFPGCTEENCVPVLEKTSGMKFNKDFFCGYSPERVNPGDKNHKLTDIVKVTSGSTPEVADFIDNLYKKIINVGTHKAESIKIAEAAKVIENTQRDINIALVNEFSLIFNKLELDTDSILKAACTKWNFMDFKPGLVGGHCIGVDPYYLTYKAVRMGYEPELILAGRRLNDNMGKFIVSKTLKLMSKKEIEIIGAEILVMGYTFKENCPDFRNTKVKDILGEFSAFNCRIDVWDPCLNEKPLNIDTGSSFVEKPVEGKYDAIIIAVAHDEFKSISATKIHSLGKRKHVLFDVKNIYDINETDLRL